MGKYIRKKSIAIIPKASGAVIDSLNSVDKTVNAPSIRVVEEELNKKQDKLTAGKNITINNGEISSDIFPLYEFTNTLTIPASWIDTGIRGNNLLETGTYIVNVYCNFAGQGGLWTEYFSGVMSWYSGGTNSTVATHIPLHNAGHAPNSGAIQLRTIRESSNGSLRLQIYSNIAMTESKPVVFKFRKII